MANKIEIISEGYRNTKVFIDGVEQKHITSVKFESSIDTYPYLKLEQSIVGDVSD